MIATLLAATILASVPDAVARTMQDPPLALVTQAQLDVLHARVVRNEKIRDSTMGCIVEALGRAGADGMSAALAGKFCETCAEQHVMGFNAEARLSLKLAELGAEVGLCALAAKKMHAEGGDKPLHTTRWVARGFGWGIVVMNLIQSITGKPLIKWGVGGSGNLAK